MNGIRLTCLIWSLVMSSRVYAFDDGNQLSLQSLLELKVETASRQAQSITDAPSIISVITKSDLEKTGASSLIDALKLVPGVEVSMGINGTWRVSIRGIRKDGNVLLLVNGLSANDFYDGRAIFDLPTAFIERVEIVRGTGSPLYGSNAIAGIINIFTLKEANYAQVSLGTDSTIYVDGAHSGQVVDGDYIVMGGYRTTDGANVNPYSSDKSAAIAGPDRTNRWVKDFYVSSSYTKGNFEGSLWAIKRNQGTWVGPRYFVGEDSDLGTTTINLDGVYKFEISDMLTVAPRLYTSYNLRDFYIQELPDGYVANNTEPFQGGGFSQEKYRGLTIGSEVQATVRFSENFSMLAGVFIENLSLDGYSLERNFQAGEQPVFKGSLGNYDNIVYEQDGRDRKISGLFNENTLSISRLNVSAGFRYDSYSDFGSSFNPRGAIIYKVSDSLSVKTIYGQTFRAPTFKELYDRTDASKAGTVGNKDLNPETSSTSELAVEVVLSKLIARANAYLNQTKNLIDAYDPSGSGGVGVYENIGDTKTGGWEVETSISLAENMKMIANFAQFTMEFDWNPDVATQGDLAFIKNRGDQYVTNQPARRLNVGLDLNLGKFRNFVSVNYGGPSEANRRSALEAQRNTKIPNYMHGNFSITYDHSEQMMVQLSGVNIGSPKYSDPDAGTNIEQMGLQGMRQPGVSYLVSTHYRF